MTLPLYRDWRGNRITIGSTVLASSILDERMTHVELTVHAILPGGRVEADLVRHSKGIPGPDQRASVPIKWLTVVTGLPESDLPTAAEQRLARRVAKVARYEARLAELDAGAEPVFIREREITLTRLEKALADA